MKDEKGAWGVRRGAEGRGIAPPPPSAFRWLVLLVGALILWPALAPPEEAEARGRSARPSRQRSYHRPVYRMNRSLPLRVTLPVKAKPAVLPSKSAFLMNARTGQLLYQAGAHRRLAPASTTKIITALVILDYYRPADPVIFSERAAQTEMSNLDLKPGAELTEEQLLYAILLHSANDACVAMAEHIAGSVENFVILMNNKARQLGALDTNFLNPTGLPEPGHYSSAYDMALSIRAAMADPRFARIAATKQRWMAWPGHDKPLLLKNHNRLLGVYPGLVGGKTGYTLAARHCFTAYAARGETELALAILGSNNVWADTRALLDYGFGRINRTALQKQLGPVLS